MHLLARIATAAAAALLVAAGLTGCGGSEALTVYSARTKDLIGPLLERFEDRTGVEVKVRYGDGPQLAGALLEEGSNPGADLFIAQEAGSLGAVADAGLTEPLPQATLDRVPPTFRSPAGHWVGLSARARVVVYNVDRVSEADLPADIEGYTAPEWRGRLAWAPTNGSFQAFVTAFRVLKGEDAARAWLLGIKANQPRSYPDNVSIVEAVGRGEVDAGFVNHYYAFQLHSQGRALKAENRYYSAGDPGSLVNVTGISLLKGSDRRDEALALVGFLLSEEAQTYFAERTFEVPTLIGARPNPALPPIEQFAQPDIDLARLGDVKGTVALLTSTGVL